MTTVDLIGIGALVQTPLAARREFEMLHCIDDEDRASLDAGVGECFIENATCRADEWLSSRRPLRT